MTRRPEPKENKTTVRREGFGLPAYLAFAAATVFTLLVCVSLGSVKLPLRETSGLLWNALAGRGR